MISLRGSLVALVTPFRNGAIDEPALRTFVRWQLEQGTDGLVPCGTTGEGATLGQDEMQLAVRVCVEESRARGKSLGLAPAPVVAGCGSNSTAQTIANVRRAKEVGADAALVVTPYYNKPSQEGLFRHYEAVAREGGLPVVLYNVPSRTSVDLLAETVARLAQVPGVIGIKEASGNIARAAEIKQLCPSSFVLLAGDDMFTLPTLALGGDGVISVVGNLVPADLAQLCDAFFAGKLEAAAQAQVRFAPLVRALFCESNPMPIKYALARAGRMLNELRLPLCSLSREGEAKVDAALAAYGKQR